MDDMLKKQRRAAERLKEDEERAWRELSPSREAEREKGGEKGVGSNNNTSPNGKKTTTGSASGSKVGKGPAVAPDIRSFFSPQKKKPQP